MGSDRVCVSIISPFGFKRAWREAPLAVGTFLLLDFHGVDIGEKCHGGCNWRARMFSWLMLSLRLVLAVVGLGYDEESHVFGDF
jgi:hypothetical protein